MHKTELSIRLGVNLRNIRKMRGLSVSSLSNIIGIGEDTIRKYERGERALTVEDMITFATILRCDPQNFIKGLFRTAGADTDLTDLTEIDSLTPYESGVFERMSTAFKHGKKPLIIADDLYMRLSPKRRREVIMALAVQADEAIREHELSVDDIPAEIELMKKALGGLYEL